MLDPTPLRDRSHRDTASSWLNQLPMTTIFSRVRRLFGPKVFGAVNAAILGFGCADAALAQHLPKLGYVISAKDRAQADTLVQQALAEYQTGDYPQALSLLEQANQLKPDQSDCWNLRGMIFLRQKAYDKAQAAFARAVALDPDLWAAQFNLAETTFQQKDYARARKDFENLLAQTDRFKHANRWELVQYKAFLCCLLQGNTPEANRRLAKLPATGGATPARLYAEAAIAYQSKKAPAAEKLVSTAQSSFSVPVNALFVDSLVQEGWQAPPPPSMPTAALAANTPPAAPGVLPNGLPLGVTLATDIPGEKNHPYYVVDPKVEAAAAEPLPLPDAGTRPIVGKITPALQTSPASVSNKVPPKVLIAAQAPPPEPTPDVELEHRGLLLDE